MKDKQDQEFELTIEGEKDLDQILADVHENILPRKKIWLVFLGVALAMLLAYIDSTGLSIILPYIADDLQAQDTIAWAGTASMIGNTLCMCLIGRVSDIFGRKYALIGCLIIQAIAELACGLAQKSYQFYIFRGFSGLGTGGINSLTMVILSDVVPLQQRGFYQGFLGASASFGNGVGIFLCSAFVEYQTWRKFFFTLTPIISFSALLVWLVVPYTNQQVNIKEKVQQIDFPGILLSSISIIFLLVPISGGGSTYEWNSPLIISFFVIGGVSIVIFLIVEQKIARLPIIPPYLFTSKFALTCLLTQSMFFGMCHFSTVYYIPYYFGTIRGFSTMKTSLYYLILIGIQTTFAILTGEIISRTGHYLLVIIIGYAVWNVGIGLLLLFERESSLSVVIISLVCIGFGLGATFQPTLLATQAQSLRKDRAVVISTRNLVRSFGAAMGIAISSTILSNSYIKLLKANGQEMFNEIEIEYLSKQLFSSTLLKSLSYEKSIFLKDLYMKALKHVFYFWLGCAGYCFISTLPVRDSGLDSADRKKV